MKLRHIFTGLVSVPPLVESEVLKTGVTIVWLWEEPPEFIVKLETPLAPPYASLGEVPSTEETLWVWLWDPSVEVS
jgi:hypothetical protein